MKKNLLTKILIFISSILILAAIGISILGSISNQNNNYNNTPQDSFFN